MLLWKLLMQEKVIAITEGIPVADMIKANAYVKERNARLIDPTVLELLPR
jgi:succinyl-CoA synthetase alpha subunit